MKTKFLIKSLMLFLTLSVLAFNAFGQAYLLWDFEDGVCPCDEGCSVESADPDPAGGNYYLKVKKDNIKTDNSWWQWPQKDIADLNLEAMENPLLVFDYNTGSEKAYLELDVAWGGFFVYNEIAFLHSSTWKQMVVPVKELFSVYYQSDGVPVELNRAEVLGLLYYPGIWMKEGDNYEINIDNIYLKAESQKLFDFEDGVKPEEKAEFTIETTSPDTTGGASYLKVMKSGIAQWTWIGSAEKQIPGTNLKVYNKPLVSFLYNTGSKKGYLQVEVGDNTNMKWGYSVGQLESTSWKSVEVSLFDVSFSNWATDPLDWSKVKYIKIGFTTGDLTTGSDYEVSIDNITLKESPRNYEPLLRSFSVMGQVNEDLALNPGIFKSKFSDPNKDTLVSVKIVTLPDPAYGTLMLDALPVTEGQVIEATETGTMKFVPVTNFSGACVMRWTATDGDGYPDAADLELTLNHYPNLALNKPIEARFEGPMYQDRCYKRNANDGIMSTLWQDAEKLGPMISDGQYADTTWIYFDLGMPTEISALVLYWEASYAIKYSIEVSDDAVTWTFVDTIENGNGETDRILFEPLVTRYVRLTTLIGNMQYYPAIWEVQLYDKKPPSFFPIDNLVFGTVDDAADYSGIVNMSWDTDSIYMLFEIKDDSIVTAGNAWQVDNIEIYFDMDNSKNIHWPRNGSWMANDPTFDANDYQLRIVPTKPWETNNSLQGASQAYTRMTNGYDFKLSIPWDSLMPGFIPEVGKEIGFDILVSDNDAMASDANRNQITWNAPTIYPFNDPSIWGILQLSDTGTFESVPDVERPTAPANLTAITDGSNTILSWYPSMDNRVVQYYFISHLFKGAEISLDTALAQPDVNSFEFTGLGDGVHTFKVTAVDIYGNRSSIMSVKDTITGIPDETVASLALYPNPAGNVIYLGDVITEEAVVDIYNLGGQLMKSCNIHAGESEIYIADLPRGMYTVRLRNSNEVRIAKLIKN